MKIKDYKSVLGIVLFLLVVIANIYIAANYYFLKTNKLTEFYIWQANIKEK